MLPLLLAALAAAAPEIPCGTPHLWAPVTAAPDPLPPPPNGPAERDAYGVPGVDRSEHFALRYGYVTWTEPAARARLLGALEDAYALQIGQMGHTAPLGMPDTRFNVYLGDTGNGAPPGYGTGGYYSADSEGWPMIVVSAATLGNPGFADVTAAHEFYHAVQGATRRFNYDIGGPSAWFWEASATWASAVVFPDQPLYATFLFGYALLPHLPINAFRYPSTGATEEYYQYGAFIWPLHVAQRTGSWDAVVDVWEREHGLDDPLEALRGALADRGHDLDALWLDHIARNVNWDYPNGDVYRRSVAAYNYLPESGNLEAVSLSSWGFEGLRDGPAALRPHRYGSNALVMLAPRDGVYTLTVEGEPSGSTGSPARHGAVVVLDAPGQPSRYEPVRFQGARGEIALDGLRAYTRLTLVVGAWTPERGPFWRTETFPYRYGVAYEPPAAEPEPTEPESGGCETLGAPPLGALALLASVALARRRRHRTSLV
jgi:uncharacterized protein (TIGR03382 family)